MRMTKRERERAESDAILHAQFDGTLYPDAAQINALTEQVIAAMKAIRDRQPPLTSGELYAVRTALDRNAMWVMRARSTINDAIVHARMREAYSLHNGEPK